MRVAAITATCGRHRCIERSVRFFLDQDYDDCYQLIYQNSLVEQRLNRNIPEGKVIIVNQNSNLETHEPYKNLGEIYRDAVKSILPGTDAVVFFDDDDVFLPDHISEGVAGLVRCGKTAYKPQYSYYKDKGRFIKMINTFEPSIFVKVDHILKYGFSDKTTEQHLQWVHPLIEQNEICADPEGKSTLIYDWSQEISVFKTSGNPKNPENFNNYRKASNDHGDGIITPISTRDAERYYKSLNFGV